MQNGQEHIAEPLDYLYEELPPERMAEVKRHLAECPECRARMREIRDTVKTYRQISHPKPPPGLAARVADAAIKEADAGAVGLLRGRIPSAASLAASLDHMAVEPAPTPREREARMEEEFEKLKDELRGEMHRGWSAWLFHPAWAVAASVAFLFALALHFSPRYGRYQETVYVRPGIETQGQGQWSDERSRASVALSREAADMPPRGDLSPALQQAKMRQETALAAQPRLGEPLPAPAPMPQAPASSPLENADVPEQGQAMAEASATNDAVFSAGTGAAPEADEVLLAEVAPGESVDDMLLLNRQQAHDGAVTTERKELAGKLRPPETAASGMAAEQRSIPEPEAAVQETELAAVTPPAQPAQKPAPKSAASPVPEPPSSVRPPVLAEKDVKTPDLYTIPMPSVAEARDGNGNALLTSPGSVAPMLSPAVQDFSSLPPLDLSSAPITGRQDDDGADMDSEELFSGASVADLSVSGPVVAFGSGAFAPLGDSALSSASGSPPPAIYEGEDLYAAGLADMDGSSRDAREKPEVVVLDMAGMEPPQLIARPDTGDVRERIQSLTTLAGMQMANGEIADAWKTIEMLRRYDAKAAETLSELLREIEQAALAETTPPEERADVSTGEMSASSTAEPQAESVTESFSSSGSVPPSGSATTSKYDVLTLPPVDDTVDPAPEADRRTPDATYESAPIPVPEDVVAPRPLSFVGEMVEPPEDPPMTLVRVPPSVTPPAAYDAPVVVDIHVPEAASAAPLPRQRGNGSRAAALVQTLAEALPSSEAAATLDDNGGWSSAPVVVHQPPAVAPYAAADPVPPAPSQKQSRRPFTTDPYLRDY